MLKHFCDINQLHGEKKALFQCESRKSNHNHLEVISTIIPRYSVRLWHLIDVYNRICSRLGGNGNVFGKGTKTACRPSGTAARILRVCCKLTPPRTSSSSCLAAPVLQSVSIDALPQKTNSTSYLLGCWLDSVSTVDYRYSEDPFPVSPRSVAASNQNYLSRSETEVNPGVSSGKGSYPKEAQCKKAMGIHFPKKW